MGNRRMVLHVDDDAVVRHIVQEHLARAGFEVIGLADPTQAIDALVESHCRVVILDVCMPAVSGLDLLAQIKQFDGGIQVVMLTGLVSIDTVLESMRRGAEACLFKPLQDAGELISVLEAASQKADRWWDSLADLHKRRAAERGLFGNDLKATFALATHDDDHARSK
jgi:DNA-binding NtrC family response regulator